MDGCVRPERQSVANLWEDCVYAKNTLSMRCGSVLTDRCYLGFCALGLNALEPFIAMGVL